ncbi:MAG: adenosine kinase [Bacteriovoracaceae bacterium]|nr:adenosine kinase [Bacteriovoracaceae bacterium]
MKKYHVYGMGNALVDLEYHVDIDFFHSNNIAKGLMTLIEEERHYELFRTLGLAQAEKMACGGSAANSIIAVAQLGGKSFYSCKVANDSFGKFYLKDILKNAVETNLEEKTLDDGQTGKCIVMVTPDADRTMNTYLGVTSNFSSEQLDLDALKNSQYLYVEGYLVTSPSGREAMIKAKKYAQENGVRVSLTLSDPGIVAGFKKYFKEIIGSGVDLIFCNESEAISFTETKSLEEAREAMKKYAKTFAITQGAEGATLYDGKNFLQVEPFAIKAVDTLGAGDMFAGAFLYALTHGHSFADSGRLASLASSSVVGQFGPRLDAQQLVAVKKKIFK